MKKQELIEQMKKHAGGACFMTVKQFGEFLGMERHAAARRICTAQKVGGVYFIPDLAQDLMDCR